MYHFAIFFPLFSFMFNHYITLNYELRICEKAVCRLYLILIRPICGCLMPADELKQIRIEQCTSVGKYVSVKA